MPLRGRVVIVSGPPGAGKSTLARALAESADQPGGVHLVGDDFLYAIRAGFVEPHVPASESQNRAVSLALARAAFAFATDGYLTAIDWVVGPWFLDVYRAEAARVRGALDYVVLRPAEEAVVARSRHRASHAIEDYAHLRPLYRQLSDLGELERHVLDNTRCSLEETAALVRAGLADGRFRLV